MQIRRTPQKMSFKSYTAVSAEEPAVSVCLISYAAYFVCLLQNIPKQDLYIRVSRVTGGQVCLYKVQVGSEVHKNQICKRFCEANFPIAYSHTKRL